MMTFMNGIAFLVMIMSDLFTASSDIHHGPLIVGNGTEYNIEPNADFSILCEGNKPLKWTTPEIKMENLEKWTQFRTEQEASTNKKYALRLYITNMSYPFVGFYYCHYDDAKNISENSNESTSIYLYVNDTTHLTVNTDTDIHVYVKTGDVAVLPCRPTSPYVTVELQSVSPDYKEVPLNGINKMFGYDPRYGIFTNYTDKEEEVFEYRCFFERNDEDSRSSIFLYVEKPVSFLPTPYLIDANRGHTIVGGKITLSCKNVADGKNRVTFSWETPGNSIDSKRVSINNKSEKSVLTVTNVTLDDMGIYVCTVSDHHGHSAAENVTVNVFDKGVYNISMKSLDDSLYIEQKTGDGDVILTVNVWGHPPPDYTWFDHSNNAIPSIRGKKYEVTSKISFQTSEDKSLRIKNIEIDDTGNYTLLAKNQYTEQSITFFVNITGKPSVSLETGQFHLYNQKGEVRCIAEGNPIPELKWEYKRCLRPGCKYASVKDQIVTSERLRTMSVLEINASESGLVKCIATNTLGERANVTGYKVTDVPDGFAITDIADTAIVDPIAETAAYALNENVSIKCSADASNYSQITWLLDLEAINETNRIRLIPARTNYSKSVTLKIYNSHRNDSGEYTCRVVNSAGAEKNLLINISIQDPVRVGIIHTNMEGEMVEDYPKSVRMICKTEGLPKPKISWYKDDVNFDPKLSRIRFEDGKQILVFNETAAEDAGRYRCEAVYKEDVDFREIELRIKNAPEKLQRWFIYVIILLGGALVASVIYLILRVRKERKMKRELQLLGLENFEKGAIENINPELGIDDQAELLPYDKKWEFPIEHLKLGKQLGSGAFGVVLKGEAKYIIEGEPVTTVAVKMVKKTADNTYLKALASELKIMVHLGKHLNVVNLLGACTKNVAKRELLVIVEYCRFGNLQNYLLKHREHFVNQIDLQTGQVNYLIGQELLDRTYSVSSDRSNINSPLMRYATLAFSDQTKNCYTPFPTERVDYSRVHHDSEMTSSIQGDDSVMLSNNSTQPEWRSNYKGDYKGNVNPISTRDLITYAFQIARGMEYLASRKVLHGDLATRNILLSENNIVKICDFGLAKTMYKSENYRKRGDCPLPVKWMAIESIRDRIFSTQSDCWSFGIVLWELFSLGRTPYPGMPADERLYQKLVDGYRLECPEFCPKEIYKIMTECWSVKPSLRPSFTKLTERIGSLIEDTLRKHYVDLNDPYLAMNTMMLENKSDYLSMISPPDFDCLVTPHYVNDMMTQSPCPEDGYISMKPSTIFSPRIETNEKVFNFDIKYRKNCPSVEIVDEVELTPILKSPESNGPGDKGGQEIIKSVDNYVNMPENKSLNRDKNMERNYVNDNTRNWRIIH